VAVSPEIREADKEARIAILNKITKEVEHGTYTIVDLAKAYNYVTTTDAPHEPSKVGGFA
jgi:hypothetical protein